MIKFNPVFPWQLIIGGLIMSIGSIAIFVIKNLKNPLLEEPITFLSFETYMKLTVLSVLGIWMFILGSILATTPR